VWAEVCSTVPSAVQDCLVCGNRCAQQGIQWGSPSFLPKQ
jgi:hypothetical protein